MNLRELTRKWLEANGYEGLAGEYCGCEINDLMPCDEPNINCQPAYKRICPGAENCPDSENCPATETGIICMTTEKVEEEPA